ncbi:MAG: hypothetical protein IAE86_06490 [Burkholderiaceae bacterium]|nr:hypothetical protein [Burkholderiaceae bacterium]
MAHLRSIPFFAAAPGYCARGTRAWFDRHGLDLRAFTREGLDEEVLLATGDGMAAALVRWAHECADREPVS